MRAPADADRLAAIMRGSLDEPVGTDALARRAFQSRTQRMERYVRRRVVRAAGNVPFGGMFAHVITFNTYQRLLALDAMRALGVKIDTFGCPTEFEAGAAPTR